MKKLLNTLYVTKQGTYLSKEGETVVASMDKQVLMRLPIHTLSGLVCFGNVLCSPFLLGLCAERGVHVSFLTEHGKFLARVEGPVSGNVMLRMAQMKASINENASLELAKSFVAGKILNTRTLLQRRLRTHGYSPACAKAVEDLASIVKHSRNAVTIASLRGMEGDAASQYFGVFNDLLTAQVDDFSIQERNRRPPLDPMNALLSFLYTLLAHDCKGALESVGLDPQIGFLHALRSGRPSLALDLMEEFRAPLVDRFAISLVNLKQIKRDGFSFSETGAVLMSEDTRKEILIAWQKRKQEVINHPFLDENIEVGLLPYVQALLLARHIRGDLDAYPPFILK